MNAILFTGIISNPKGSFLDNVIIEYKNNEIINSNLKIACKLVNNIKDN